MVLVIHTINFYYNRSMKIMSVESLGIKLVTCSICLSTVFSADTSGENLCLRKRKGDFKF